MSSRPSRGLPVLALGFRPFFLLGAAWAAAGAALWGIVLASGHPLPAPFAPYQWHAREMLFGYAGAIIAGFLLTAPGNWTGAPMPSGPRLGALVALWLAGRLLPYAHTLIPGPVLLAVDASFFPVLGLYLFRFLRRFGQSRNLFFPLLLMGMGIANALSHLGVRNAAGEALGTEVMLYLVVLVVAIMGGRVIPGFTKGRFPGGTTRNRPRINTAAMVLLILAAAAALAALPQHGLGLLFAAASAAHAVRLAGWYTREIWTDSLTWVLHLGYAWLVAGLALKAAACIGIGSALLARHALTIGAIGTITLGMICRVTLGHTGRPFVLPRGTATAFRLVSAAALLRVALPLILPGAYWVGAYAAAAAWTLAFGLYLVQYGPFLVRPNLTGRG